MLVESLTSKVAALMAHEQDNGETTSKIFTGDQLKIFASVGAAQVAAPPDRQRNRKNKIASERIKCHAEAISHSNCPSARWR
jgi:hypothetical protein